MECLLPGPALRWFPGPTILLRHARSAQVRLQQTWACLWQQGRALWAAAALIPVVLGGRVSRQAGRKVFVAQCRELLFCSSKAILPRSWLSNSTPLTGSWKKFISAAKAAMAEGSWPN